MFIKHNRNRDALYNLATCESVGVSGKILHVVYQDKKLSIEYEEVSAAQAALKYILEGLKRGDNLINV